MAVTNQPVSVSNATPFTQVTFTASGTSDSQIGIMGRDYPESGLANFMLFQWMVNGAAVPGGTTGSLSLEADPVAQQRADCLPDEGAGLRGRRRRPAVEQQHARGATVATNSAVLALSYASVFQQNGGGAVLDLRFNKPMNPASLLNATYTLTNATTPGGYILGADERLHQWLAAAASLANLPSARQRRCTRVFKFQ